MSYMLRTYVEFLQGRTTSNRLQSLIEDSFVGKSSLVESASRS
jgi:hypothetical protein